MSLKKPLSVCYLPTNSEKYTNLDSYILDDGSYLFDIGILFAANVNGTYDKPVLSVNSSLQTALDSGIIKKLQTNGMKVILSILGNNQEAGISTLTNNGVKSLANQLVSLVNKYNLDGLDFDDEYCTGTPNDSSFPLLIINLRKQLPNKLLTLYFYGHASTTLTYNGTNIASLLNYAWNAVYSSYGILPIPGMTKNQLSAAAVNLRPGTKTFTSQAIADSYATRTITDGYGAYLFWDLYNKDLSSYLSSVSKLLYKQGTSYKP